MNHFLRLLFVLSLIIPQAGFTAQVTYSTLESRQDEHWAPGVSRIDQLVTDRRYSPVDRFRIHKIFRTTAPDSRGSSGTAPILLLPGASMGFSSFEIPANPASGYETTITATLALAGHDVYGISPRETSIVGRCMKECPSLTKCPEGPVVDCSGLKHLDFDLVLEDIDFVLRKMESEHPGEKPIIGGLSLGSMLTIAALNKWPDRFSGAIIWEGILYSSDRAVREANTKFCADSKKRLAKGELFNAQELGGFKFLSEVTQSDPKKGAPWAFLLGLSPFSNYKEVFFALGTMKNGDPPIFGRKYTYFTRDPGSKTKAQYVSEWKLHAIIDQFAYLEPLAINRDWSCALAGDRKFTSNLARFKQPTLVIAAENGMGWYMMSNVKQLGSKQVRWEFRKKEAHADLVLKDGDRAVAADLILNWLEGIRN
jgi:pimeloyl-ACP methyl ester carboxylesterase